MIIATFVNWNIDTKLINNCFLIFDKNVFFKTTTTFDVKTNNKKFLTYKFFRSFCVIEINKISTIDNVNLFYNVNSNVILFDEFFL